MEGVFCGNQNCGISLDEQSDLPADQRQPCPRCGALSRNHGKGIGWSQEFHDSTAVKVKRKGRKRPLIEMFSGHQISRATGRWKRKYWVLDRANNQYKEEVRDLETDALEHFQEEPLTDHYNHGSAKNKKQQ